MLLTAGPGDAGGVLDRTAQLDATYRYTAQRVRTVLLSGHTVELRSAPSAPVEVALRDVFPPEPPSDLVAAPGPGSMDLSWEPGLEPRPGVQIAGYRVYRQDAAGQPWRLLTPQPAPTPSYRDTTVAPGKAYSYRITAVDAAGHESAPSGEITEAAGQ